MSTLTDLLNYGQSYWLDNLSRKIIRNGELQKRVSEQGLRGLTSNPSIFNKAISGSEDYDDQIKELVNSGKSLQEIYDELTIKDVQDACDILRPVFDSSGGTDGFASLEVSPYLALDKEGSIEEAKRLYARVNRPNCYIKIPGTKEGVEAIEELLYQGVNINVTLLFSIERYSEIAKAYIRALKRRDAGGKPLDRTISVASFFLSRIDVVVDELLGERILTLTTDKEPHPQKLMGKAAIASARLAYQRFMQVFSGQEWEYLKSKGAKVQRPLWASTSTKNPLYSDVYYVESLIGPDTVNTLPDETIAAFEDHGKLEANTIEKDIEGAKQTFEDLKKLGIDTEFVAQQLENEGIKKFIEPFNELMKGLAEKRNKMLQGNMSTQKINYGTLKKEIESAYASMNGQQVGKRLYEKDGFLWKEDDEDIKMIKESMGWITLADENEFKPTVKEMVDFTEQVKAEGFQYAVLLGMGGSSLCSEVARETFGTRQGYLQLLVLDNTDPEAITDVEHRIDIDRTLFIVATKSGGTKETISFYKYFYDQLQKTGKQNVGDSFVAITDDGSPLVKMAQESKFRKIFINGSDIGGRYSVLSDFGLLPMALMGVDLDALMVSANQMRISCSGEVPVVVNPGLSLGTTMGICARHGRDKVTFVLSKSISSFGFWVEQLIAESTGKEGTGLIPVNGEALGAPDVYGNDRLFVRIALASDESTEDEQKLKALEDAGHPVVRIQLNEKTDLGGEYFRWEIATAIAGIILGINPFDQPNVAESKKNTENLLDEWKKNGSFKSLPAIVEENNYSLYGSKQAIINSDAHSVDAAISEFVSLGQEGDYIALLPYFLMTDERRNVLQQWRMQLRNKYKVATTLLEGPRYLHSTGQLHKGGPDTGLYILITEDATGELPIPGEQFGFATLHQAQSLGDYRSLSDKERRVIRINLGKEVDGALKQLMTNLKNANAVNNA